MPRATDRVPDQQIFAQRPAIMRAKCADRKQLIAPPGQQGRLGPDMAEQHRTIRKQRQIEPIGQVGTTQCGCILGHGSILLLVDLCCRDYFP